MRRNMMSGRLKIVLLPLLIGILSIGVFLRCGGAKPTAQEVEPLVPVEAPFPFPRLERPAIPDTWFDIRSYGAVEGAQVKVTPSIRKAFEAAGQSGGGHILIPPGKWLTGPIHF